jgi:voltage-gated sodium channel
LLLCGGGIIGLSFVNSVFVDAMVEDNNDDIKEQLNRIEKKLDELENRN